MACLEKHSCYRQARNRCCLASSRFSFVLAASIATKEGWEANDRCRDSSTHPANGTRKSRLGRSENSRRAFETWLLRLRTYRLSLSPALIAVRESEQTPGCFPSQ